MHVGVGEKEKVAENQISIIIEVNLPLSVCIIVHMCTMCRCVQ